MPAESLTLQIRTFCCVSEPARRIGSRFLLDRRAAVSGAMLTAGAGDRGPGARDGMNIKMHVIDAVLILMVIRQIREHLLDARSWPPRCSRSGSPRCCSCTRCLPTAAACLTADGVRAGFAGRSSLPPRPGRGVWFMRGAAAVACTARACWLPGRAKVMTAHCLPSAAIHRYAAVSGGRRTETLLRWMRCC